MAFFSGSQDFGHTIVYCGTESPYVLTLVDSSEVSGKKGLVEVQHTPTTVNPLNLKFGSPGGVSVEWVELHPLKNMLYAFTGFWNKAPGEVTSFEIDSSTGLLRQVTLVSCLTGGFQPCHACISKDGEWLAIAHYLGGVVSVFGCAGGCVITTDNMVARVEVPGERPSPSTRLACKGPTANGVAFDVRTAHLTVCDSFSGQVCIYRFNRNTGIVGDPPKALKVGSATGMPGQGCFQGFLAMKYGARPRHLCFHPTLLKVYVLMEFSNVVAWYSYKPRTGTIGLMEGQVRSFTSRGACSRFQWLLPRVHAAAEVAVSADGRCLFVSNRGLGMSGVQNCVQIFLIDKTLGSLTPWSQLEVGDGPRHFSVGDDYLVVGQQRGKSVALYSTDESTGDWREIDRCATSFPVDCVQCLSVDTVDPAKMLQLQKAL